MARLRPSDILLVIVLPLILYTTGGTLTAYLARDDFQWLNDARDLGVMRSAIVVGRAHFYRPVAELWWDGVIRVCGTNTVSYHSLELALHVLNVALVLYLTARLFGRRDLALATAVTWGAMPSYVGTVVWVCAVTTGLGTVWYLCAVHFAASAVGRERASRASWGCLLCAAAAMYSHEASVTLFATIPLVICLSSDAVRWRPRAVEAAGFAGLAVLLTVTTVIANRRSYVFTEGHYAAGLHALQHARDYVLAMYIGRHAVADYLALALVAIAIVLRGTRPMRAGLVWMVLTMPPYLGFTWGNVGRYTYLPTIGFCWILAGVVIWIADHVRARAGARVAAVVATVLVLAITGRFASFARHAIRDQVEWMEAYRAYRDRVTPLILPGAEAVTVPPADDPAVERDYIEPMLRWHTGQPALRVTVTER